MPVYRIDLAYDGTGFKGYARNPGVRTIQGALEEALGQVLGTRPNTKVAGRTDAGVHARAQVVSFEFDRIIDSDQLGRSLRSMLAPEIAVENVSAVPDGFSARYSAVRRHYRYTIDENPIPDPLRRHAVWHLGTTLDIAAMNRGASHFVGDHDFASLCRNREGKTTERTVFEALWERTDGLLVFGVMARAFCHQMIRSMVALCVEIGRGRMDPDEVPGILEAKDRNAAQGAAPSHGLILWEIEY